MPDGAEEHEGATAELLDREDGDPGREEVFCSVCGGEDARHRGGQVDFLLVDGGGVVGDEVDTRDLLEDLVDVREDRAVEMAVLGAGEEVAEGALGRFENGVFDLDEFLVDEGVGGRDVV